MKKAIKLFVTLSAFVLLSNCEKEVIDDITIQETESIQKKAKSSKADHEKIDFLKKGLKKKIKAYNNKNGKKNKFFKKYGKLKAKNAVTIKFPSEDSDYLVAVPFKRKKHKSKLLVAYYKNGVRKYTVIKKNKKYKKKKLASSERSFIKNSEILFELTSNNIDYTIQKKNTITKSSHNCNSQVLFYDYQNCTIAYVNPCTDHIFIVSTLGKLETCGGEFDEIILDGSYEDEEDEEEEDPWEDPYNDENDPEDNEPDEGCDEMLFDCEDGYGNEEDEDEDHIDDDDLKGKEKCIEDLLDKKGDSYVKEIMKKFEGESEFDIKIESKDKIINEGKELSGLTKSPVNGLINIQISTSQANSHSALEVARTILHEYIHADMFRKLNTSNDNPSSEDLDFLSTYEAYKNGTFEDTPQHETMAELYIHYMRDALKDFHKNALKGDYNYNTNYGVNPSPNTFYEALAWRGLKENNVQAYKDLSDAKKKELDKALNDYFHSITKNCPN